MLTTVPPPQAVGTCLWRGVEAAAEGGWRDNTQAGAERRGGKSSMVADDKKGLFPVTSTCCLYLANPTLLQHFSLLKSQLVVPHWCPSWRITKGRSLPTCQAAPRSQDALHPRFPPPAPPLLSLSPQLWLLGTRNTFPWALWMVGCGGAFGGAAGLC